jgi:hypothetical protein
LHDELNYKGDKEIQGDRWLKNTGDREIRADSLSFPSSPLSPFLSPIEDNPVLLTFLAFPDQ